MMTVKQRSETASKMSILLGLEASSIVKRRVFLTLGKVEVRMVNESFAKFASFQEWLTSNLALNTEDEVSLASVEYFRRMFEDLLSDSITKEFSNIDIAIPLVRFQLPDPSQHFGKTL